MWTSNWNGLSIMKWSDKFLWHESSLSLQYCILFNSVCARVSVICNDTTTHLRVSGKLILSFHSTHRSSQDIIINLVDIDKINIRKIWFVMFWLVIDKLWCRIYRCRFLLPRHCHKEPRLPREVLPTNAWSHATVCAHLAHTHKLTRRSNITVIGRGAQWLSGAKNPVYYGPLTLR